MIPMMPYFSDDVYAGVDNEVVVSTFEELESEIADASSGDIIYIDQDIEFENMIILNKSLTMKGLNTSSGGLPVLSVASGGYRHFEIDTSNIDINFEGMTLLGPGESGAATNAPNGGILVQYGINYVNMDVKDAKFKNIIDTIENVKTRDYGAAISFMYNKDTYTHDALNNVLNVDKCIFENNDLLGDTDKAGSAIIPPQTSRISNSTFTSNGLSAIYPCYKTTTDIINSTFTHNSSVVQGGALSLSPDGVYNIIGCTFWGNTGKAGGAIIADRSECLNIVNCTMIENKATGATSGYANSGGGAVQVAADNKMVLTNIINSTMVNNHAQYRGGGAIFGETTHNATLNIQGSVITGNKLGSSSDTQNEDVNWKSAKYQNQIPSDSTYSELSILGQKNTDYSKTDIFGSVNPSLSNNGGTTQTIPILDDTNVARNVIPVSTYNGWIDGLPNMGSDLKSMCKNYDQRGAGRPDKVNSNSSGLVDIGAYEVIDPVSLNLSFDPNGGTLDNTDSISVEYGKACPELKAPARKGYKFEGWYTEVSGGYQIKEGDVINLLGDTTLYAQWSIAKYKLKFDKNYDGGGKYKATMVKYNSQYGTLPTPSARAGYTFKGWYENASCTDDKVNSTDVVTQTADFSLYAKWEGDKHTVTFKTQGGTNDNATKTVEYGSTFGALQTTTREGYSLKGWNRSSNGEGAWVTSNTAVNILDDINIYAIWEAGKYKVNLDFKGGSGTPAYLNVTYNETYAGLPGSPTKANYSFEEWNTLSDGTGTKITSGSIVKITEDTTLSAIWLGDAITLNYDLNYPNAPTPATDNARIGENYKIPGTNPQRTGYTFEGWYLSSAGTGSKVTSKTAIENSSYDTLFAKWSPNKYVVGFNSQGGSEVNSTISAVYDSEYTGLPSDPIRPGYTFGGWFTGTNGLGTQISEGSTVKITEDITANAKWTANKYKINLDYNGTTGSPNEITVTFGNSYTGLPTDPQRTGYMFLGWNTADDSSGTTISAVDTVTTTPSITLYAIWEAENYTLTFNGNGGTPNTSTETVIYGSKYIFPSSEPTRDGYEFDGWYTQASDGEEKTDADTYAITGNSTLYAHWSAKTLKVSFDSQGGSTVSPIEVTFDSNYPVLETPEKEGYGFTGWNTKSDGTGNKIDSTTKVAIITNTTLYAIWSASDFNVTFYNNYSDGGTFIENTAKIGGKYTIPGTDPQRTGYTFEGWYLNENGSGDQITSLTTVSSINNNELYAKWKAKSYTVSFDSDGGSDVTTTLSATYDNTYPTLPDGPSKTGYTFDGWYTEKNGEGTKIEEGKKVTITNNITLYAKWKAKKYTITFDSKGGSNDGVTMSAIYGQSYGTLPITTKSGFGFTGWNTKSDGSGVSITGSSKVAITDDTTFYAQWSASSLTVTFDSKGGSNDGTTKSVNYGDTYGTLPVTTKAGYSFVNWNTKADGSGEKITSLSTVEETNDVILYAIWKADSLVVSFDSDGGSPVNATISAVFDSKYPTFPNDPTREGYVFSGWHTSKGGFGERISSGDDVTITKDIVLYANWSMTDFIVTGSPISGVGSGYIYDGTTLIFTEPGNYVVSMQPGVKTTTKCSIKVADSTNCDITLSGVAIDVSKDAGRAALETGAFSNVKINLTGENHLESESERAGLEIGPNITQSVEILGPGKLTAIGGIGGSGIGTGVDKPMPGVKISPYAVIEATGGDATANYGAGAGIGSGGSTDDNQMGSSNISIHDLGVIAKGGKSYGDPVTGDLLFGNGATIGNGGIEGEDGKIIGKFRSFTYENNNTTSPNSITLSYVGNAKLPGLYWINHFEKNFDTDLISGLFWSDSPDGLGMVNLPAGEIYIKSNEKTFYAVDEAIDDIEVIYSTNYEGYDYTGKYLNIKEDGVYYLAMKKGLDETTKGAIRVAKDVKAEIQLINVKSDLSKVNSVTAFDIMEDAKVIVLLSGSSKFVSGTNKAGINVATDASLTIQNAHNGYLYTAGGAYGAGIGGSKGQNATNITIENDAAVEAVGGINAPGIGGGGNTGSNPYGSSSAINIGSLGVMTEGSNAPSIGEGANDTNSGTAIEKYGELVYNSNEDTANPSKNDKITLSYVDNVKLPDVKWLKRFDSSYNNTTKPFAYWGDENTGIDGSVYKVRNEHSIKDITNAGSTGGIITLYALSAPDSFTLSPAAVRVEAGDIVNFSIPGYEDGIIGGLNWSCIGSPDILDIVDSKGLATATALKSGYVTVRAESKIDPDNYAQATIIIDKCAPKDVKITPDPGYTEVGESLELTAEVTDSDAELQDFNWTVVDGDENISIGTTTNKASISLSGNTVGTATISAVSISNPSVSDTAIVKIMPDPPKGLDISDINGEPEIEYLDSGKFRATAEGTEAGNYTVGFKIVKGAKIAKVSSSAIVNGNEYEATIEGKDVGQAVLRAYITEYPRMYTEMDITVTPFVPEVVSAPSGSAIKFGDSLSDSKLDGGLVSYKGTELTGSWKWEDSDTKPSGGYTFRYHNAVFTPDNKIYGQITTLASLYVSGHENASIDENDLNIVVDRSKPSDKEINMNTGTYGVKDVVLNEGKVNEIVLKRSVDYKVEDGKVVLCKEFLGLLPVGEHKLTFIMDGGINPVITINVSDSSAIKGTLKIGRSTHSMYTSTSSKLNATHSKPGTKITWSSSNNSIATVDANGLVKTRKNEGMVSITAKTPSGENASCLVKVQHNVTKIRTPLNSYNIKRKKTITVPIVSDSGKVTVRSRITARSSNPKVATVAVSGNKIKIKANKKKTGKAKITIATYNGKKKIINIKVVKKAVKLKTIKVKGLKKKYKKGKTAQIKVTPVSKKATNLKVTYKTNKKKVASVDAAGKVMFKKKGKATVTVKIGKKTYKKKITVK